MGSADGWTTFVWLVRMSLGDGLVVPVYVLLAALPIATLFDRSYPALLRALAAVALAHVELLAVLLMSASLPGAARTHPSLSYVQMGMSVAGVLGVWRVTKPFRDTHPWALTLFLFAFGILNLMVWFVGGMALTGDWL